MVTGEVPLSRREELLLVVACELRPTLAVGDPPVPSVDSGLGAVLNGLSGHLYLRPAEGVAT
jgi:hypothetical protein